MEDLNLSAIVDQLKKSCLKNLEEPVTIEIQQYDEFTLEDIEILGTDIIQFIGKNKREAPVSVFQHVSQLSFKVTGHKEREPRIFNLN